MDHIEGYRNLIHAVIHRAVLDTFLPPIDKKNKIDPLARSAMKFLLSEDIDSWLIILDRDPVTFKRKLVDSMFAQKSDVDDSDRRAFRINHNLYEKEMAHLRKVDVFLKRQHEWTE
jgi:hypothetical protein